MAAAAGDRRKIPGSLTTPRSFGATTHAVSAPRNRWNRHESTSTLTSDLSGRADPDSYAGTPRSPRQHSPLRNPIGPHASRPLTRRTTQAAAPPPGREAPPLNKATRRECVHTPLPGHPTGTDLKSRPSTRSGVLQHAHAIRAALGRHHQPRASPRPRPCANLRGLHGPARGLGLFCAPRGPTPHSPREIT